MYGCIAVHTPAATACLEISAGVALILPKRFPKPFNGKRRAEDTTIAKNIGQGFRYAKDGHPHTVDHVKLHALLEPLFWKSDESDSRILDAQAPSFRTDCHPYARRHLIGKIIKGKRGDETDHPVRNVLVGFGEDMMGIHFRVRKLIESTAKTDNGPSAREARDGCCRDTRRPELSEADHSALPEKGYRPVLPPV
jgi:hypothetical protein